MFLQVILNVLGNGIESLHISIILSTNTRDISMLFSATEIFMIYIPEIQYKLVGIIDGTFHLYDPRWITQTINIRNLIVK